MHQLSCVVSAGDDLGGMQGYSAEQGYSAGVSCKDTAQGYGAGSRATKVSQHAEGPCSDRFGPEGQCSDRFGPGVTTRTIHSNDQLSNEALP